MKKGFQELIKEKERQKKKEDKRKRREGLQTRTVLRSRFKWEEATVDLRNNAGKGVVLGTGSAALFQGLQGVASLT